MFKPKRVWTTLDRRRITGIYAKPGPASTQGEPVESVLIPVHVWQPIALLCRRWLAFRDMGLREPVFGEGDWHQVVDAEGPARRAFLTSGLLPHLAPDVPTPENVDERKLLLAERDALKAEIAQLHAQLAARREPPVSSFDIRRTLAYQDAAVWMDKDPVHAFRAGLEYAVKLLTQLGYLRPS